MQGLVSPIRIMKMSCALVCAGMVKIVRMIKAPISRARPSWMMFYDVLAIDFLRSIIGKNGANDERIIEAIHKLKDKLEK